jgi:hypothetical protein
MAKYEVDLSAWLIVEAKNEEEAFAVGHAIVDKMITKSKEAGDHTFDGLVAGVTEYEED